MDGNKIPMLQFKPINRMWMTIAIGAALLLAMLLPKLVFGKIYTVSSSVAFVLVMTNFIYGYLLKMQKLDQNETEQSVNEYFMMNAQRFVGFIVVMVIVSVVFPIHKGSFFIAAIVSYIVFILLDYLNMNQIEVDSRIDENKKRAMDEALPYGEKKTDA